MSGWQLSGDAPSLYIRFAATFMEPWTDDLIRLAKCKDGDRAWKADLAAANSHLLPHNGSVAVCVLITI
jgi:hypothetical protein